MDVIVRSNENYVLLTGPRCNISHETTAKRSGRRAGQSRQVVINPWIAAIIEFINVVIRPDVKDMLLLVPRRGKAGQPGGSVGNRRSSLAKRHRPAPRAGGHAVALFREIAKEMSFSLLYL